ncbi:hypothetical protein [Actinokineospora xionganensis]|nr:hypothetical protein [Actinokineospora xionganensis]
MDSTPPSEPTPTPAEREARLRALSKAGRERYASLLDRLSK